MHHENKAKRSPWQIVGLVVIFLLALLIILTFVIFGMFRDEGSAPKIFGYRVYVVDNDRMEPRIPKGAAVFVEEGKMPDPTKQSVILCRIDDQLWVIGFVGTQTTESGETSYLVRYDNASDDKTWGIRESDIIGVAVTQDKFAGAVISFASSKLGIMVIVIIPCLLLIVYEVVMLIIGSRGDVRKSGSKKTASSHKSSSGKESKHSYSSDKNRDVFKTGDVREADIRHMSGEPDLIPEREDIKAPTDQKKDDRFVEKQLRKANDKFNTTLLETTGNIETDEITLDDIKIEPEPVVRRTDILREGAEALESLKLEAEKISDIDKTAEDVQTVIDVPEIHSDVKEDVQVKFEDVKKAVETVSESMKTADNANKDLSPERIDELIKLLEEEKKRLSE